MKREAKFMFPRVKQPTSFLYPSTGQMSSKLKNWTRSFCLATSKLELKTEATRVERTRQTKKFSVFCVIVDFTATPSKKFDFTVIKHKHCKSPVNRDSCSDYVSKLIMVTASKTSKAKFFLVLLSLKVSSKNSSSS